MAAEILGAAFEDDLWTAHRAAMDTFRALDPDAPPAPPPVDRASLLDLKVELAERLLAPCRLCWLRCPVDRRVQPGFCGLGAELRPYRDFVHLGEELELIPTHAVFLAGCSYRCVYCSDWDHVVRPGEDAAVGVDRLSESIARRRREGAASLSFIGGSPDLSLPGILRALAGAPVSVPVVWNSNLSGTPEAHDLLEGVLDATVADLKYGSEACARRGSGVKGSLAVARRNLLRVAGEAYLVVRHLVLPGHLSCCTLPVLDWLAAELPGVRVNLMPQYRPTPQVRDTPWDRLPTVDELTLARAHAATLPLCLEAPGRVRGPAASASASPPPVAGFESAITIEADGRIVIENLSPELAALAEELGGAVELRERKDAGGPWLE